MVSGHNTSIWFIIGSLLLVYGVIIFISNVYECLFPSQSYTIILSELHFGVWWGALLIIIGLVYVIAFRPWKKKEA
jgi:hypothetical protein